MSATDEGLAEHLVRTRKSRGLTLRDVERITDGKVSNAYLSQLETGKIVNPGVVMLHRLSAAYAIDFADLCERACVGDALPAAPPICPSCGQVVMPPLPSTEGA